MRRRAKPAKAKVEAKLPGVRKVPKSDSARVRDLERRLAEAREQQRATSEILGVISRSPSDVAPVFATIARNAMHLLGGATGGVFLLTGDRVHFGAAATRETIGPIGDLTFPMSLSEFSRHRPVLAKVLETRAPASVADMETDPRTTTEARQFARAVGFRSNAIVPMLRGDELIGLIVVARAEPRATTDDEMALLKTFADQAVIAIENVRLFNETKQSLEQQTATSGILRVISQSPTNVQPVFDAIARNAVRLCDGLFGNVYRFDGERIHLVASGNFTPEQLAQYRASWPRALSDQGDPVTVIRSGRVLHVRDNERHPGFLTAPSEVQDNIRRRGVRSFVGVPMFQQNQVIGAIFVSHRGVDAFTDAHVELLKTFADQAVIAIENVRLFNETKEALEQQTATSEILRVISSSLTDVNPVFRTILANSNRLCDASFSVLWLWDGEAPTAVAHENVSPAMAEALRTARPLPNRRSPLGLSILEQTIVHVADVLTDPRFTPEDVPSYRLESARSILCVPMLREGSLVGLINIWRREPRAFTDGQIALVRTFADQAVIAIENVRLFTELQEKNRALTQAHAQVTEALDQQTATSEILSVISSSPTELQPVFDTIVKNAARLCGADDAILQRVDGDVLRVAAHVGALPSTWTEMPIIPDLVAGQAVLERRTIHVHDMVEEHARGHYPASVEHRRLVGYRTLLVTPLLRENVALGVIVMRRLEVRDFTAGQIALLQTFADQAVIAIENVRLFKELEARNRDLTASSEILRVIAASPTDVQPVFDSIVESASKLCDAVFSALGSFDGELMDIVAAHNWTPAAWAIARRAFPAPPSRAMATGRAILERAVVHVPDVELDHEYGPSEISRAVGFRSILAVPMLRDGVPLGAIAVGRVAPGRFSDNQIALLKTFADQAVIAIENVRLFTETKEALERQTATAEILKVISSSPTNIQPVLDVMAESAARLCEAADASIFRVDADRIRLVAQHGAMPHGLVGEWTLPLVRQGVAGRSVIDARTVHLADVLAEADEFPVTIPNARRVGFRTMLSVPLVRDGVGIGAIQVLRREPRLFRERQVALLETFADQAVIAIENVRLFKELEARNRDLTEALEQQTATSDVLRVISQSQTDLQPVFDTVAESAARLCEASDTSIFRLDGDRLLRVAHHGSIPAGVIGEFAVPLVRGSFAGRCVLDGRIVHIADGQTEANEFPEGSEFARRLGFRAILLVPLLREGVAIGAITLRRTEPRLFTERQVTLLKTFADQAVIAIENVRLFKELEARTHDLTRSVGELRALGEIGQAISSTLDLQTVLRTIVARATQLAGVDAGVIYEYDAERELFEPRATERLEEDIVQMLEATPIRKGQGATGRLAESPEPMQVADLRDVATQIPARDALVRGGYRAVLAVPLVREGHLIGGLTVFRKTPGEFALGTVDLLRTFATQSALAIQNARLFREIEDKSRQLEVASQHKSEFLANMSHELRTPLNAIIGFSEVLSERMFGELNEKQEEYLKDIYASGTHLLSLINDILDLSKIEAGRMELELTDFDLPQAIDNALILVRERAGRRGIALEHSVDERLGEIRGDERKVKQVLLNLLSNALRFTPEGGRVGVRAGMVDGMAEISVTDTGVGIAQEDQGAIFEEFRQVGTADKKAEGTGLGLTLCRKFVELHGGRIWVKSQLGQGATFTFTIPVRRRGE